MVVFATHWHELAMGVHVCPHPEPPSHIPPHPIPPGFPREPAWSSLLHASNLPWSSVDWLDLLAVQGTLKRLLQHHSSEASILWHSAFFMVHVHIWLLENGISQARILEWVAIPFSRGSSWPRDWTQVSGFAGRVLTIQASREACRHFNDDHSELYEVIPHCSFDSHLSNN